MPIYLILIVLLRCFSIYMLCWALTLSGFLMATFNWNSPMPYQDAAQFGGYLFVGIALWFGAPWVSRAIIGGFEGELDVQAYSLRQLITGLFAAFGLYFVLSRLHTLLFHVAFVYFASASSIEIISPEVVPTTQASLVSSGVSIVIGALLIWKAAALARWLTTRYERSESSA